VIENRGHGLPTQYIPIQIYGWVQSTSNSAPAYMNTLIAISFRERTNKKSKKLLAPPLTLYPYRRLSVALIPHPQLTVMVVIVPQPFSSCSFSPPVCVCVYVCLSVFFFHSLYCCLSSQVLPATASDRHISDGFQIKLPKYPPYLPYAWCDGGVIESTVVTYAMLEVFYSAVV